jgi:hypothetical protein
LVVSTLRIDLSNTYIIIRWTLNNNAINNSSLILNLQLYIIIFYNDGYVVR